MTFVLPDGRRLDAAPPLAWRDERERAHSAPADVDDVKWLPCWDGTPFRLGYVIDVLHPLANAGSSHQTALTS